MAGENAVSKKHIDHLNSIFRKVLESRLSVTTSQFFNSRVPNHLSSLKPDGFVIYWPEHSRQLAPNSSLTKNLIIDLPCLLLNIEAKLYTGDMKDAEIALVTKFQASPHTLFCNVGISMDLEKQTYSIWILSPFKNDPQMVDNLSLVDPQSSMILVEKDVSLEDNEHAALKEAAKFMKKVLAHTRSAKVQTMTYQRDRAGVIFNEVTAVDFTSLNAAALIKLVPFTNVNVKSNVEKALLRLRGLCQKQFIYKHTFVKDVSRYNDIMQLFKNQSDPSLHIEAMMMLGPLLPRMLAGQDGNSQAPANSIQAKPVKGDDSRSIVTSSVSTSPAIAQKLAYNSCVTLMCEKIDFAFFQHMPIDQLRRFMIYLDDHSLKAYDPGLKAYIQNLLPKEQSPKEQSPEKQSPETQPADQSPETQPAEQSQEQQSAELHAVSLPPIQAYVDLMFAMIAAYFDKGYAHCDVRWPNLSFWTYPYHETPLLSLFDAEYALHCVDNVTLDKGLRTYQSVSPFLTMLTSAAQQAQNKKTEQQRKLTEQKDELTEQKDILTKQKDILTKQLITALRSGHSDVQSLIEDIESKIEDIESKIEDIESKIADIESKIEDIEPKIADVELKIADMKVKAEVSVDHKVAVIISNAMLLSGASALPITAGEAIIANMTAEVCLLPSRLLNLGTALLVPATVIDCICLLFCRFPLLLRVTQASSCSSLFVAFCPIIAFITRILDKLRELAEKAKTTATTGEAKKALLAASKSLLVTLLIDFESTYENERKPQAELTENENEASFIRNYQPGRTTQRSTLGQNAQNGGTPVSRRIRSRTSKK